MLDKKKQYIFNYTYFTVINVTECLVKSLMKKVLRQSFFLHKKRSLKLTFIILKAS